MSMLPSRVGNSHAFASGDQPLDTTRGLECDIALDICDGPPEQPYPTFSGVQLQELQDLFKLPEHMMEREVTIWIQETVRTEVTIANQAVWARIEELEQRLAHAPEVKSQCGEPQIHQGVKMEVQSGSGRVDDDKVVEDQASSDNKEHLTRLAAKVEDAEASHNAQEGQTREAQSGDGGSRLNVAVAADDLGEVPDSRTLTVSWRALQRQENIDPNYELGETVWDLLLLVGINIMSPTDEVIAFILGTCNMFIQFLFIRLVSSIAELEEDEPGHSDFVDAMLDWRIMYAHTPKYANAFTNKPLAYTVCARDSTNMEGIFQADIYVNVHNYLDSPLGFNSGDLLCMLAVLLWLLTCFKEAKHCLSKFQGVWCTIHRYGNQELKGYRRCLSAQSDIIIEATGNVVNGTMASKSLRFRCSFVRGCMVTIFVFVPRLALLAMLGITGVDYLVATIELEELILNAVALEVIFHVDEMLYEIFVPTTSKTVLTKTHLMPCPNWGPATASAQSYLKLGVMTGLLLFIRIEILGPIISNVREVERVMCGGDKEFLAAETSIGIVFAGHPTRKIEVNTDDYQYSAILQRTRLSEASKLNSSLLYLDSDITEMPVYPLPDVKTAIHTAERTIVQSLTHLRSSDVGCSKDMSWTFGPPLTGENAYEAIHNYLAKVFAPLTRPNCMTLEANEHCYTSDQEGIITRFFCPITCGLNFPQSGNAFMAPVFGVPGSCQAEFVNLLEKRRFFHFKCTDVPTFHMSWSIYAKSMVNSLVAWWPFFGRGNSSAAAAIAEKIRTSLLKGCHAIGDPGFYIKIEGTQIQFPLTNLFCNPNLLRETFGFDSKSMRLRCPISCGCLSMRNQYWRDGLNWNREIGWKEQCPASCFNYTVWR